MTDAQTETLLAALRQAKVDAEAAKERVLELEASLIAELHGQGLTSIHTQIGGETITGTLVEATRILIDEPRLQKSVGALTWAKITKRVLDKPRLEAAMAKGDVDPAVVAAASEEVPNKPYVKVTAKDVRRVRTQSSAARKTKIRGK